MKLESDKIYDKWRNVTDLSKLSARELLERDVDRQRSMDMWDQLKLPDLSRFSSSSSDSLRALKISSAETGEEAFSHFPPENSKTLTRGSSVTSSKRPDSVKQAMNSSPFDTDSIPLGAGGVNGGGISSSYIKPNAVSAEMVPTYNEYVNSVDQGVVKFARRAMLGKASPKANFTVSMANEREIADLRRLLGLDVRTFAHNARPNAFQHINKRHGIVGVQDHSMADLNDVGRIPYVLREYDSVELVKVKDGGVQGSKEFYNADGSFAPLIRYEKRINGHYYVVEAAPDSKGHKLQLVSAYIEKAKNNEIAPPPNANAPGLTSGNGVAPISGSMLHQGGSHVNAQDFISTLPDAQRFVYSVLRELGLKHGMSLNKVARAYIEQFHKEYDRQVDALAQDFYNYKPKGVTIASVPSDSSGAVMGEAPMRFSHNEPWYSDFYARRGRKPTRKDALELVSAYIEKANKKKPVQLPDAKSPGLTPDNAAENAASLDNMLYQGGSHVNAQDFISTLPAAQRFAYSVLRESSKGCHRKTV